MSRLPPSSTLFPYTTLFRSAFFDTFGIVDATTQGGPAGATQILVYKVYYDGVKAADLGGSSAQSAVLMAIVIALTVVQFKLDRKSTRLNSSHVEISYAVFCL